MAINRQFVVGGIVGLLITPAALSLYFFWLTAPLTDPQILLLEFEDGCVVGVDPPERMGCDVSGKMDFCAHRREKFYWTAGDEDIRFTVVFSNGSPTPVREVGGYGDCGTYSLEKRRNEQNQQILECLVRRGPRKDYYYKYRIRAGTREVESRGGKVREEACEIEPHIVIRDRPAQPQ